MSYTIRPLEEKDRLFVTTALKNLWGSEQIIYSSMVFHASLLPGFLAEEEGRVIGLVTYTLRHPGEATTSIGSQDKDSIASLQNDNQNICQIISLNALTPGKGIGTALLEEVKRVAKKNDCLKISVITTNDNLSALKFYQKKEFLLKALYPNALEKSREIKPEIPLIGEDGIPLRDEIELEMLL